MPDGERILDWRQVYALPALPEHLVVVGSGVTGAEFGSAYTEMGVKVTLISSRDRVLPHEDADAAAVIEGMFADRGVHIMSTGPGRLGGPRRRRGGGLARRRPAGPGSHALMTVGSVPNTADLGLETVGIESAAAVSSRWTGCRGPTCPASTPPATAPAC